MTEVNTPALRTPLCDSIDTAPCTPTSLPSPCQSIHYLCVLKRSSVGTKSAHVQSRIVCRIKILWKVYAFSLLTGSLLYRRVARCLKLILKYTFSCEFSKNKRAHERVNISHCIIFIEKIFRDTSREDQLCKNICFNILCNDICGIVSLIKATNVVTLRKYMHQILGISIMFI